MLIQFALKQATEKRLSIKIDEPVFFLKRNPIFNNQPPLFYIGDPGALVDGISLSYDPVYGPDNKTAIEFVWECETFDTADIEGLVAVGSEMLLTNLSSNCDDISTKVERGIRQLKVAERVEDVGYLFKVDVI